jgi:signal peptidase II
MKKYIKYIIIELLLVGAVIALDLITKETIYAKAEAQGRISFIKGVLSFVAVRNEGASFGMLSSNTLLLTIVSAVSSAGLLAFLIGSIKHRHILLRSSLILIIGGAVGNLVDRVWLGYVRDFMEYDFVEFAVFNMADVCLTIGTILLVIYVLFFYKEKGKATEKQ